jgi:hypothetical protein
VATMLEKLKFQELIEEIITVKRRLRAMSFYQFLLSMVLAIYVGFSRLHHLRYVARDPMLTRILKVLTLPVQSTYWRFLDSLHGGVAQQLLQVQQKMRERVWAAAQVRLDCITLDTDTTVHTMLQPVALTYPVTVVAGLITAAVRLMPSRTNPVGVQVSALRLRVVKRRK